ncbi:hypothetical protein [Elizabethkingia occulta]|uniref:hypothetical protein n=1 Tax=Elizabethkingia occulta TaxID=1867263 RepID=UPI000999C955|nr:hypothetical protein [Elizabethkingia occulta]OPB92544.1 hypothetical protein BB020_08035 [Elizabethkingia occulta]
MKNKTNWILSFTGLTSFILGLVSCRTAETENVLSGGKAAVSIHLLGAAYSNEIKGSAQASLGRDLSGLNSTGIHHTGVLITPSTYLAAELSPVREDAVKSQASLEKKLVADAGNPLGMGIKFRVLAYKASDGSYVSSQDYIIGQAGGSLALEQGTAYNIICYSYGVNTLPVLTAGEKNNLGSAVVNYDNMNRDFMYQNISYTPSESTNTLNITLNHLVARVTTFVNVSPMVGVVNSIANAKIYLGNYSDGVISLSGGSMGNLTQSIAQETVDFSGNSFPLQTAIAKPLFINADGVNSIGNFALDININGTTKTFGFSTNGFIITPGNDTKMSFNFRKCGAYVGPSNFVENWKDFMCHNLGADTNADPFTPSASIHGAKYQWGAQTGEAGRYISQATDQSTSGAIAGWNTTPKANGSWDDAAKTVNDPCPAGYRIPTMYDFQGLGTYNTITHIGTWTSSPANYSTGVMFGKFLFLPAAGYRNQTNGALVSRGLISYYAGTTSSGGTGNVGGGYISSGFVGSIGNVLRTYGYAVRCVAE